MKKQIIFSIAVIISIILLKTEVKAQSIRTSYFMENAPHRNQLNPAFASPRGYVGLPVLNQLQFGIESNLQLSDYLYQVPSTNKLALFMHPEVEVSTFLNNLKPYNDFNLDVYTNLVTLGLHTEIGFWTFDVGTHANANFNIPYDFFAFAKKGMSDPLLGDEYHIKNLTVGASAYSEVAVGYSHEIIKNLRVGAKIKYLRGIAYVKAGIEKMDIEMRPEYWRIETNGMLTAYGKEITFEKDVDGNITGIDKFSPGLGGSGLGFDLGLTYSPIENLMISAAVVDLGAIRWKKSMAHVAKSSGLVDFRGLKEVDFESVNGEETSVEEQINTLKEGALDMTRFKEETLFESEKQKLRTQVNFGVEYRILDQKLRFGLLSNTRYGEPNTNSELTTSANYLPLKWLNTTLSYSFLKSNFQSFGLALNIVTKVANLYMGSDYIIYHVNPQFIPIKTGNFNIQMGAVIPLAMAKKTTPFFDYELNSNVFEMLKFRKSPKKRNRR